MRENLFSSVGLASCCAGAVPLGGDRLRSVCVAVPCCCRELLACCGMAAAESVSPQTSLRLSQELGVLVALSASPPGFAGLKRCLCAGCCTAVLEFATCVCALRFIVPEA